MPLVHVVAIVRTDALPDVERGLREIGIPGITVDRVKGFGEYANFLTPDWMSACARVEVFTDAAQVQAIIDSIMRWAHSGSAGDGIVAVLPVEKIYRIRDGADLLMLHGRSDAV